jgi:hypothetical protein
MRPWHLLSAAALLLSCATAQAELSNEDLAKLAQNPVGNIVSVPFHYAADWQLRAQIQFMFPSNVLCNAQGHP